MSDEHGPIHLLPDEVAENEAREARIAEEAKKLGGELAATVKEFEASGGGNGGVPIPTDAQKAIAGASAIVAKHEADGGTVKPIGDNAERLFGADGERAPLEDIADDAKAKAAEPRTPTREELDAMLKQDQDARAIACRAEITAACVKHNCQLTAMPTLDPMIDGGFSVGASPFVRAL